MAHIRWFMVNRWIVPYQYHLSSIHSDQKKHRYLWECDGWKTVVYSRNKKHSKFCFDFFLQLIVFVPEKKTIQLLKNAHCFFNDVVSHCAMSSCLIGLPPGKLAMVSIVARGMWGESHKKSTLSSYFLLRTSHMLHGAGIFTYKTGWWFGQMLVQ